MVKDAKDKLQTIPPYWIEHSNEHSLELKDWVDKTTRAGKTEAAKELAAVARKMDEAVRYLSLALKKLP